MKNSFLVAVALMALAACTAPKETEVPLVYDVENTGAAFAAPSMPARDALPRVMGLTDPLAWSDGSGRAEDFASWSRRRAEIAQEIQHYEIGTKPSVEAGQVKARMAGDTLFVDVTVGDETLTLSSLITYPTSGQPPYPLIIGTSHISLPGSIFAERPIALMTYHERQVCGYSQFRGELDRTKYGFTRLYPELINNGAYSEWAWGLSRLIDGLQQLVTGCSYAGKMALFCGAFDERVALTIAQEPGGGGAAAWRVSHEMEGVEDLDRTDYHWFLESLRENFHGDSVYHLPYDHHELCALVCPRALLVLGNPDYPWLADLSAYVSVNAAREVWKQFGIEDRVGYSIVAGHGHCQLPESQFPEVEAFIEKFLLGNDSIDTRDISIAPLYRDSVDVNRWIDWR